jgi:hypothetical protein
MPGGVLLFQRLSVSTMGAEWFHGRVREGIGWVTLAIATRQGKQSQKPEIGSQKSEGRYRAMRDASFLDSVLWFLVSDR